MSHGDYVDRLPPGFVGIASTPAIPFAAMMDEKRHFYGVQFHPEVNQTQHGSEFLHRFAQAVCGATEVTPIHAKAHDLMEKIRVTVGGDTVILGLSGGVDSAVAAALLLRAIGKRVIGIFVDTGLLRRQEEDAIRRALPGLNMVKVDARERFLAALAGVQEAEDKRRLIGHLFVEVFETQASKINQAKWLAQGTIHSDVIESGETSQKSQTIKSHHNVAGLPKSMSLKLLEPLRALFKDEVIQLGIELGLPQEILYKHPFPGPGFAVRILGEVKREYVDILRRADAIFIEELHKHHWYYRVRQAFAVFLPNKSVGVMGDARHYGYTIGLRAVETDDFMTARWARLPYALLETVSNRIINEIHSVSRVVYDISSKPPATIEWE